MGDDEFRQELAWNNVDSDWFHPPRKGRRDNNNENLYYSQHLWRENNEKSVLVGLFASLLLSVSAQAADKLKMGVVVKIGGIPWFNRHGGRHQSESAKRGIDAWMVGPTAADPECRCAPSRDLIGQKVDIIGVVPNDARVLEPVLKRAQEAGSRDRARIPGQKSPTGILSWWTPRSTGQPHASAGRLHERKQGRVCGVCRQPDGAAAHHLVGLGHQLPEAALPEHAAGGRQVRRGESLDDSVRTTNDLMAKYPDLKGVLAFGSQGPIGAGRSGAQPRQKQRYLRHWAVQPRPGRFAGQSRRHQGRLYLESMVAGEVFVRIADMMQRRKNHRWHDHRGYG